MSGAISAGQASCVGEKAGEGLSNTTRNEIVEGRGVLAGEGRGPGVSRRLCLCDLAESVIVIDESLEFSLRDWQHHPQ